MEHYLQQCKDRNAMIEMIENPPPPFELSDNDEKTEDVLIGKRECK